MLKPLYPVDRNDASLVNERFFRKPSIFPSTMLK